MHGEVMTAEDRGAVGYMQNRLQRRNGDWGGKAWVAAVPGAKALHRLLT